jgi:hypothetical protein
MYLPQQSEKAGSAPLRRMAVGEPPQGQTLGNAEGVDKFKVKPKPFE